MANTTVVRDPWTGSTRLGGGLSDDWTEAEMELKEKSCDSNESFSPEFVAAVWIWARAEFGKDAHTMTIVELAEYWYAFA